MKVYANKETSVLQNADGGKGAIALQDNRVQSVFQKSQVAALSAEKSDEAPVQKKANTTGLPDQLKSGIENLSGHAMDDVKVHYNSSQPAKLNAHAYAQGNQIHLAPGQEKHLPHEAWHVVQQKQGRVKPTMQMKGKVSVNDDQGLEKEADAMGAKAANATKSQRVLKYVNAGDKAPVQRKGEAEALSNIVTDGGGDKKEMRRGNNRNSVTDTGGKSSAWIKYLRSDWVAKDLKAEVKRLYLAAHEPPRDFEAWYRQRVIMIEGLIYKHIRFGNCGEFSSALYGELQQSTRNQYVYKASWMWKVKDSELTPPMRAFKRQYPEYVIKSPKADHAFVVTYPTLVANEELRYVEASDVEHYKSGDRVPDYMEIRYKMAAMDKEQAMVADGWLDRKVKTLEQANLDDTNALLTNPTKAGEHTLAPDMRAEIIAWAEALKTRVENDMGFKSSARTAHPGSYGDPSHKGLAAVDERPAYVKAFHGSTAEQVRNFNLARRTEKVKLIAYLKKTETSLILNLGQQILTVDRRNYYIRFLPLLIDGNLTRLYTHFIKNDVAKFNRLLEELEVLIGAREFPAKKEEIDELYYSIPEEASAMQPFSEWLAEINAVNEADEKVVNYGELVTELEALAGRSAFGAKRSEEAALHDLIPAKYRNSTILKRLVSKADVAIDANDKIIQYRGIIAELEALVARRGFNAKRDQEANLHNLIPQQFKALRVLTLLTDRADIAIDANEKIIQYDRIVAELEVLIGRRGFNAKCDQETELYHSIPEQFQTLGKVTALIERVNEAIKNDQLARTRSASRTRQL